MLKYFKLYSIILILLISVSCSQEIPQIDKLFYEVQGPIKTMTVIQEHNERIGKEVYYFSPKGELEKIEYFNSFSDDKEVEIGNVSYFDKQEDQTRYFYQIYFNSKKVVNSYSIQYLKNNQIHFLLESTNKDFRVVKDVFYNEENKPIKSILKGNVRTDSTHLRREYFYNQNKDLEYTILTNYIQNTVEKVWVKNSKKDQHGNITYAEHQDKDGKILFKWECEYTYYTKFK